MYITTLFGLRTALGIAVALGLSYLSILVAVLFLDTILFSFPKLDLAGWVVTLAWFSLIGLMGAIGAMVGWVDEDDPLKIDRTLLSITLIGGVGGSWSGMLYSNAVNAGSVFTDHPVSGAALFAASLLANGGATALAVIRYTR